MGLAIKMLVDDVELTGELADTPLAGELAGRLPLEVAMSRWGKEYYGSPAQGLTAKAGSTQEVMAVGDLAWWPQGGALCLFFGPTPASQGDEPRAVGPVARLGAVRGDWPRVSALGPSVTVRVEAA